MDLNADLGEGFGAWRLGDDEALLRLVTSANVACGFHAGDAVTMRRVCEWAADRGVAVGAQVGYRDLAGFGRRRIDYDLAELRDEIIYQIAALDGFCRLQGERVRYVKPHGALYNTASVDVWQASAIVAAIVDYDRTLPVLCLPGSTLATVADGAGLRVVAEGYADRAYQRRRHAGAPRPARSRDLRCGHCGGARVPAGDRRRGGDARTARSSRPQWSRCACTGTRPARSS